MQVDDEPTYYYLDDEDEDWAITNSTVEYLTTADLWTNL